MPLKNRITATFQTSLRPFRHSTVAISGRIMLDRLFSNADVPRNLVISIGGAWTTFLIKHLLKFVQINDAFDRDRIKLLPRLPAGWLESRRVLFIFSDPEDVFWSIRRRGWLHMHAGELGCLAYQFTLGNLRQKLFERTVRKQIATFHSYGSDNDMLLNYDNIWDQIEEISAFFEIDDERFIRDFPVSRSRAPRPNTPLRMPIS